MEPLPTGAGAEGVFLGRTRLEHHPDHGALRHLDYDAYRPMARAVLEQLAHRAIEAHGCFAVRLHHALGVVRPGEASVLVQVLTGHRAASFAACRFLIDTLKAEAPIWKKEVWADGTTWSEGQPAAAGGADGAAP